MRIESTVNLDRRYLQRLNSICDEFFLTRSQLFVLLLRKFINKQHLSYACFQRVKYQQRRAKKYWKTVHVCFDPDIFEKCSDVRKFCKISVSRLLAMSIDFCLETVLKDLSESQEGNSTDNYLHNYFCICKNEQKTVTFHICWEIPDWKEVKKQLGEEKKHKK